MRGWLCTYWEQGWEGMRWWVFQPGETGEPSEMILLSSCAGARRTIYNPNGSVLWSGKLVKVVAREGFLVLRRISDWDGGWRPEGVTWTSGAVGVSTTPPLASELEADD